MNIIKACVVCERFKSWEKMEQMKLTWRQKLEMHFKMSWNFEMLADKTLEQRQTLSHYKHNETIYVLLENGLQ